MPIVLRVKQYRFGFYASDIDEPPHVHVKSGRGEAKYWIGPPTELEWNRGLRPHEMNEVERIIADHRDELLERWHDFFNR